METDNTDTVQATYTYSPWGDGVATGGKDLISMSRAGVSSYYHFDGLGSVVALSNDTGSIVERYSYDIFGEPNRTSDVNNPYLFTGRAYDGETGNYYYRARYYNPQIGRFISRDPILSPVQMGDNFFWLLPSLTGSPQKMHSYVYCSNNPANYIDPGGNIAAWVWVAVIGATILLVYCLHCIHKMVEAQRKCMEMMPPEPPHYNDPCANLNQMEENLKYDIAVDKIWRECIKNFKNEFPSCVPCIVGSYFGA
jgi:RHS repeat-associated protein